ncbi:hypothetical protein AAG570_008663 [Ranatra chinensis]|uniref:Uncharacterized protein n=1 Tax=Ranatra chinensis TaxID=642074 RepID=A0ABD0YRI6_9HEMI
MRLERAFTLHIECRLVGDIELLNQRKTPSTTDGKCVLACLMKKVGLMNENGQFSADYLKTMAPHVHMGNQQQISMVQTLADGCSAEIPKALDECETAAKIDECIARKGKELGLVSPPPPPPPPPMG